MPIRVQCPNKSCAKSMTVKDEFAGKTGKCPACGTPVKVPAVAPVPAKETLAPASQADQDTVEGEVSTPNPERPVSPPAPPGSIRAQCAACGKTMNVKPQFAGKVGKCPGCGKPVKVPGAAAPAVQKQVPVSLPKPVRPAPPPVEDEEPEQLLPKAGRKPVMPPGLELENEEPDVVEDDDEPAPKRKPAAAKKPAPDDVDEEPDVVEDDDEPAPKRKPAAAKKPPRDKEEEPDEEPDEEQITATPKSKARKPAHDEDDDVDEESEDEEDARPKGKRRKSKGGTVAAAATFEKLYKFWYYAAIALVSLVVLYFICSAITTATAVSTVTSTEVKLVGDPKNPRFQVERPSTGALGVMVLLTWGVIFLAWLSWLATWAMGCIFLYKAWDLIQDGKPRTSPGLAVGFLFIPIFSLYWIFVAFWGLAQDLNMYAQKHEIEARQAAVDRVFLALILCLIPCVNLAGLVLLLLAMRSVKDTCVDIATAKAG
jgi:hypothetical protein